MLLTFTPNPCLERTIALPDFTPNASQRIPSEAVSQSIGGKALNAARVAAKFGIETVALAPIGRRQLDFLTDLAREDGLIPDFTPVESDTRVCLNLLHQRGANTEIIENGALLSVAAGAQLLEKWRRHLPRARLALIGGAYPPSLDAGFELHAAILCQMAAQAGVPVLYDGRGAAFSRALRSKTPPWAIKPNLAEAELILDRAIETPDQERRAVRDLRSRGAQVVLLSCGERGCYLGHAGGIEWISAPHVDLVSSVGCGDALVGAFAAIWLESANLVEAARWGVAAASASAEHALPARVSREEAAELLAQTRLHPREIALQSV